MCARITGDAQPLALAQPELVLGMERSAPADHAENPAQRIVVLDQERAGRRPDEDLDAGAAGEPLEVRQFVGVLARAADEERKIAVHAMTRAGDLVGERRA